MKRGTKIAALLLGLALVLPACNPISGASKSSEQASVPASEQGGSSELEANYEVSIKNKTALQETWAVGDPSRKVEIETQPKANIAELVGQGIIQILSSDTEKLTIAGQMASPVAAGQVTITVKCGQSQDAVDVTLNPKVTNKEKFEIDHEGTEDDPLTNEEAIKVTKASNYNNEDLYVKGTIASFYHNPGERTDGAVSWFLEPATAGGEKFEVYKCYKKGTGTASYLTEDDVWVGGVATAHGTFTKYNDQCETSSAIFVKCEGTKPQPRQTINATVSEALTVAKALEDGASTWDYYNVTGYVVKKSSPNYFLADTAEAAADDKNMLELYNVADAIVPKLTKNAKVTVKMILKNYHGQIENGLAIADADVTVVTPGGEWIVVPEPNVETKTLAEFIALENTKAKAYRVSAQIKSFKTGETKDKYGNMTLTDGTNDLTIYGSSVTATALKWNEADAYVFTNPQDFLDKDVSKNAKVGQIATLKLIRADYNGAIQGTGILESVEDPRATAIALDKDTLNIALGETGTLTATLTPANAIDTIAWSSSDPAVATVENGVVTPVAAGSTTITAKVSDEIKAECAVTVVTGSIAARSVELNETSGSVVLGEQVTLTATVEPADSTDSVVWSSSDETVATVENGVVSTLKIGTATITATAGSVHADYALTVARDSRWATEFSVTDVKDITLPSSGDTADKYYVSAKITAITSTQYGNGNAITEEGTEFIIYGMYNNNGQARYDAMEADQKPVVGDIVVLWGKFTNFKGDAEIKNAWVMQRNGVVCVAPAATAIALNKNEIEVNEGSTYTLKATATPASGSLEALTWESSNNAVATVADGVVTGVAAGTATITAKISDEIKAECVVTVKAPELHYASATTIENGEKYVLGIKKDDIEYMLSATVGVVAKNPAATKINKLTDLKEADAWTATVTVVDGVNQIVLSAVVGGKTLYLNGKDDSQGISVGETLSGYWVLTNTDGVLSLSHSSTTRLLCGYVASGATEVSNFRSYGSGNSNVILYKYSATAIV